MRQAPAIDVIRHLQDLGARIVATDPVAMEKAAPLLNGTRLVDDPYECVRDADCVVLITEWDEFRNLDWSRVADLVRGRVVVDGRNCLDGGQLVALGFSYRSVGRPALVP
jgi:UDPglucose 6-dehydrogenase